MPAATGRNERAELHRQIWAIADDLRGAVNGWNFMSYVLGTLFYRFLSEKIELKMNGNERSATRNAAFSYAELTDAQAEAGRKANVKTYGFHIAPSHLFKNVCARAEQDANLNETLGRIFRAIEESSRGEESEQEFKDLFAGMDFNSTQNLGATVDERNRRLVKLLKGVARMQLGAVGDSTIDPFGDAYEYLMKMYAARAGQAGGEFFTPQEASRVLAKITTKGKRHVNMVYDPACGSVSLLMQVARVIGKDNVLRGFYGQEINPTTHQLCRMNLFLHDIDVHKFDIALGDTLIRPNESHANLEPFEVIVSNPPYALHWAGDSDPTLVNDPRYAPAGVLAPRTKADYAFILHSLAWLAENGCAAIVCFPGIFYRTGAEQRIRKYLVENNYVDAIIDLPPNIFFGTSIATTILVLRKNKQNDNTILFVDAKDQFVKDGNKNRLTDENIDAIFKFYADRAEVEHRTAVVPFEKIVEHDFNLSVSTYVDSTIPPPPIDIAAVNAEIAEVVAHANALRAAVDATVQEMVS